jgi:hypothetical protein
MEKLQERLAGAQRRLERLSIAREESSDTIWTGDPKNRLAHGRVAQTSLVPLLVAVANDHFLDQRRHIHEPQDEPVTLTDTPQTPAGPFDSALPAGQSRPPPIP